MPRTVNDYLEQFEREFPFGTFVRRLFSGVGAVPIFVAPTPRIVNAAPGSWVLHVRLPPRLEDSFGFTRQFLVFCTNVGDLQTRGITQLKRLIELAEPPVATDFAMLVTADVRAQDKVRDWAVERTDGLVVLAVDRDLLRATLDREDPADAFPHLLEGALSERNLYDERDPVRGERFFGRAEELRELDRIISQGHSHVGVFGLRRIGKTSLLLELADRLRRRPEIIPIYLDLELSSMVDSAAHVAHRFGDEIALRVSSRTTLSHGQARRALSLSADWSDVEPRKLIADLGVRLVNLLRGGALDGQRLVLILDEAEILLPTAQTPKPQTIDLLRAIRGVSQETQQLTLVLAGVNATPSESAVLGEDEDNPLFGLLALRYLGPLEPSASDDLIRMVGRKMRIRWDPPATAAVTAHVGAHPLLARLAASDVATANRVRPLRPNLDMVTPVLRTFHDRNSDIFTQMVQSLRRYYPDELEVLKWLARGDDGLARALVADEPQILNHLVGYGVVDKETLSISVPAFHAWLSARDI